MTGTWESESRRLSEVPIQKMIETKKKKKKKKNGTLKRSKESFEKQRKTQLERGLTYDMTKGMKWHNDGVRNMPVRYGEEPLASFKPGKLTFNV